MVTLLIGNGFDLSFSLPTKYSDFLRFVSQFINYISEEFECESDYQSFFSELEKNDVDVFNELIDLICDNCLIDYFLGVYNSLLSEGKENWIDFEKELSRVIQALDFGYLSLKDEFDEGNPRAVLDERYRVVLGRIFNSEITRTTSFWVSPSWFENAKNQLLDGLDKLRRGFELYLIYRVLPSISKAKTTLDANHPLKRLASRITNVISFNYTNTYSELFENSDSTCRYCFVHGEAKDSDTIESCNMVLGIDEYLDYPRRDLDNAFIEFKKFYQKISFHTNSDFQDWVDEAVQMSKMNTKFRFSNYLIMIGHSLDITDKDIIASLIKVPNTTTLIYYHSPESKQRLIKNLVKVLGEDTLIAMTRGSNPAIVFVDNLEELESYIEG